MNRAQLYLWSVLHAREHTGDLFSDFDSETMRERYFRDPEQRQFEMEAAVGLWARRDEISDVDDYLRNLREDDRSERLLPA